MQVRILPWRNTGTLNVRSALSPVVHSYRAFVRLHADDTVTCMNNIELLSGDLVFKTWGRYLHPHMGGGGCIQPGVELTHLPTGIVVRCDSEKSQLRNKDKALQELKGRLACMAS